MFVPSTRPWMGSKWKWFHSRVVPIRDASPSPEKKGRIAGVQIQHGLDRFLIYVGQDHCFEYGFSPGDDLGYILIKLAVIQVGVGVDERRQSES